MRLQKDILGIEETADLLFSLARCKFFKKKSQLSKTFKIN